jgi:hypothetical protein
MRWGVAFGVAVRFGVGVGVDFLAADGGSFGVGVGVRFGVGVGVGRGVRVGVGVGLGLGVGRGVRVGVGVGTGVGAGGSEGFRTATKPEGEPGRVGWSASAVTGKLADSVIPAT